MFKRIIVATDDSALSEQAVTKAIELSLLCAAELRVLTVAHLEAHSYFDGASLLSPMQVEEAHHRSISAAQAVVDAAKARAIDKGVRQVEGVVAKSNHVAESIIEFAKTHDCDLIVMASHGRRAPSEC